ncbi:amidohydrolase family protein [Actinomadura sp. 7K507]|uniref:amidohydrolase family protein n=1 Tax=Actinomadura sp. 7K507 TaxID=2530365 RepID=UPI00104F085F|nr:amidohydrolase family protein [Actinomadura sp. 7K507]TDC92041.1 amidohydrolase [Actinomadura sp. 7K507]
MTVVDSQWHWYPTAFLDAHIGRTHGPRAERTAEGYVYEVSPDEVWKYDRRFTDLDHQVRVLDEAGIDMAVVSVAAAGDVNDREREEAHDLCLLLNEELSRAQATHPGRFAGLAHLPLKHPDLALDMLEDAVGRLGLRGIYLPGSIDGMSVADERLWPVYARAEELGLPLFLHPTRSFREPRVTPYKMEVTIGYMFDTSFASMSLIVGGVLDRYPRLKIVHPHVGGALPYLHGRIDVYRGKGWWPGLERPFADYLRRMWFDTVCNQPESLSLLADLVGSSRLLFSSDYPYWSTRHGIDLVRKVIPAGQVAGVLGGNAIELLSPAVGAVPTPASPATPVPE